jgi:4-amino-4-deoxy-L-arabinose transferase-like glycosyltransferase
MMAARPLPLHTCAFDSDGYTRGASRWPAGSPGSAPPCSTTSPPVWPDEGLFADPALSWLRSWTLATPLLADVFPGMAERTYWMPPLHFFYLAAFMAIFGEHIEALRLSSLFAAALVLWAVWHIGRQRMPKGSAAAWWPVLLLMTSVLFVRGALVARMEMLTLLWILLALDQTARLWSPQARLRHAFAAGACSGLACLTHPIGVVAPLAALGAGLFAGPTGGAAAARHVAVFAATALAIVTPWLVYIALDVPEFLAQMGAQLERKQGMLGPWDRALALWSLLSPHASIRIATAALAVAGLWGGARLVRGDPRWMPFALATPLLLAVATGTLELWYVLYPLSFVALGTLGWVAERPPTARTWIASGVLVIFAALNAALLSGTALRSARTRDYRAWTAALEACAIAPLPDGTRVLLNSIPDPYPAILAHRDRLHLRHVPPRDVVRGGLTLDTVDVLILGPTQLDQALETVVSGEPNVWRIHAVVAGGYAGRVAVRRPLGLDCAPAASQGRGEPPGSP